MNIHFLKPSVKFGWFSCQRLLFIFLWFLITFPCVSCAPGPASPRPEGCSAVAGADDEGELDNQCRLIRRFTDQIMLSLATHNYQNLEQFLPPERASLSGRETARLLLGAQFPTLIINRWNAGEIEVSFSDNGLGAQAQVKVFYRRAPNRKPQSSVFTFRFHRLSNLADWRLSLPR